jgi:hypothetical protein
MKFPTQNGIRCEQGDQELARNYYLMIVQGASHVVQVDQEIPAAEKERQST